MLQAYVFCACVFHAYACLRHVKAVNALQVCICVRACPQVEGTVNVRTRDNVVHGMRPVAEVVQLLAHERDSRSLTSAFGSKHEDSEQQQAAAAAPAADS